MVSLKFVFVRSKLEQCQHSFPAAGFWKLGTVSWAGGGGGGSQKEKLHFVHGCSSLVSL